MGPALDVVMVWEPRPGGAVAKIVITSAGQRTENLQGIWDALLRDASDPEKGFTMASVAA
jgi:hypothetical protein